MNLREMVRKFDLQVLTCPDKLERTASSGYVSDMLSDVMGNAPEGAVWVTSQVHQNIVAVAMLRSLAAVVITGGRAPQQETKEKAAEQGVVLLASKDCSFDLVGRLYEAKIRGGGK
jgi:predicted transcriptional regulator